MQKIIFFLFLLSIAFNPVFANNSKIELTDGSTVNGKIISYTNGVYAVNSETMGTILINESKIKNIGFEVLTDNQPIVQLSNSPQFTEQTEVLKNQLMSNPQTMDTIQSLKDDPQIQEIFNDPQIMAAIKSGDFNALTKNEKFMSLTRNPKIQKLKDSVSK